MCVLTPGAQIVVASLDSENVESRIVSPLNHCSGKTSQKTLTPFLPPPPPSINSRPDGGFIPCAYYCTSYWFYILATCTIKLNSVLFISFWGGGDWGVIMTWGCGWIMQVVGFCANEVINNVSVCRENLI